MQAYLQLLTQWILLAKVAELLIYLLWSIFCALHPVLVGTPHVTQANFACFFVQINLCAKPKKLLLTQHSEAKSTVINWVHDCSFPIFCCCCSRTFFYFFYFDIFNLSSIWKQRTIFQTKLIGFIMARELCMCIWMD